MRKIKLQQFEGPLDLLLQLIEQQELDITQVSLAQVTEQYLAYLKDPSGMSPDELADFLVVAAKLLLIKSRALLPELVGEGEDGSDLERQLKIFREYYDASRRLWKIVLRRRFSFSRERAAVAIEQVFAPPRGVDAAKLRELFLGILKEIEPIVSLPREVVTRAMSIQEKIEQIRQTILERAMVNFGLLLKRAKSRVEVIVTFLALLELVKQRFIVVTQDQLFSDIVVRRVEDASGRKAGVRENL